MLEFFGRLFLHLRFVIIKTNSILGHHICGDDRGASALTQNGRGAPVCRRQQRLSFDRAIGRGQKGGTMYRRDLSKGTIRNRFFADR
jgi:hypothetical protein